MTDLFAPRHPITNEQLLELRAHWTAEREAYPGWAITPYDNRNRVWNSTNRWISDVLRMADKLRTPEDILLLFELNWRLERCMMPLFIDWVNQIVPVVNRYRPFQDSDSLPQETIAPSSVGYSHLQWEVVTQAWVNLVYALAREAREDQDSLQFDTWLRMAEPSKSLRPEWAGKWHHEKSLFALMRLDRAAVVKAIEQWPRATDEPFWEARRAAVLAEIGSFSEAEQVAEAALQNIRSRLRPFTNDFTALSQEGWVMVLLGALRQAKDMTGTSARRKMFVSRWHELRAYGSDPWQELRLLDLALATEPPEELPPLQVRPSFDPGEANRTRNYTFEPAAWKALPAFALLRLFEEAAIPLHLGTLSIHADTAARAARWLRPYAPLWSLSTIIRIGKEDEIKTAFPRWLIAGLTPKQVESFYNLAMPPLRSALSRIWTSWQEARADIHYRLIEPNIELLSRLYFRLSRQRRDEMFSLACQIHRQSSVLGQLGLRDSIVKLFERIFFAMSELELSRHLQQLMDLPISAKSPDPFVARRWVEPTTFINPRRHRLWAVSERHILAHSIERLQAVLRDGLPDERCRAVSRLAALHVLGVLNEQERSTFAEGLWRRLDPLKHLPADTYIPNYSFLWLPEPSPGRAKEALIGYLLGRDVPSIATVAQDGRVQYSHPIGNELAGYVEDLSMATLWMTPSDPARLINWTTQQASTFLEKLAVWWPYQKTVLQKMASDYEVHSGMLTVLESALEVFGRVVLPRLPKSRFPAEASQALAILRDMESCGISLLGISPSLLFVEPEGVDKISEDIRAGLARKTESVTRRAIFAVHNWAVLPIHYSPPEAIRPELIEDLINKIFFRVQPLLASALVVISDLFEFVPNLFEGEITGKLLLALDALAVETNISALRRCAFEPSDEPLLIEAEDRPSCRQYSASLAAHLANRLIESGEELPPVLQTWKRIGTGDPLPEVQQAWSRIFRH